MTGGKPAMRSVISPLTTRPDEPAAEQFESADDLDIAGVDPPLVIPPGEYVAVGVGSSLFPVFGKTTLVVWLEMSVPEEEDGKPFPILGRFFNIKKERGRWVPPPKGHYAREWTLVTGYVAARADRMSPRVFRGVRMLVEVVTVTTDASANPLPKGMEYSKVKRIIKALGPRTTL
jgi:hypothetical protein